MAWKSITLTLLNSEDAEAIEEHLLSLDALAVSYTDAADEPILEPALNTTPLWSSTNLTALFDKDTYLEDIKMSLNLIFGEGTFKVIEEKELEDKVWEREWLEHFEPLKFGERLWICPASMQIPSNQQHERNVVVDMDPGMAFGTGTHETTALCLEWLDSANVRKKDILDYGSGSGILAIAALKLGAKQATCLDIDIQAIEASIANAERNNVEQQLKAYLPDDTDWSEDETFDVILANILAIPLIAIVQDVRRRLRRGGQIVLSGILATQAESVSKVYAPYFNMDTVARKGDWVRLSGRLKTPSQMIGDEECVTICPNCDESFIVSADDLDLADGEVRCGECDTIFFAIDFIDPDPDSIPANPDGKFDTHTVPKAHLITGMWMHNKGKLVPVTPTPSAKNETPKHSDTDTLHTQEAKKSVSENITDKAVDTGIVPDAHAITGLWPTEKITAELAKAADEAKTDTSTLDINETADPNATPTKSKHADANHDEPALDTQDKSRSARSTDNINPEKHTPKPVNEILLENIEQISPAAQLHELEEATPLDIQELSNLQGSKTPKNNKLWLLVSILSLVLLLSQIIHKQRNDLAMHPKFGDNIQSLYKKLNLPIEPNWDLSAYSINASRVDLNPLNPDQLVASFNLSNLSVQAQAFPIVRLSLFDSWGARISYRDLTVENYSPQDFKNNSIFPARGRIEVRVTIKDPGSIAKDFETQVCLEKNGIIRCQTKETNQ